MRGVLCSNRFNGQNRNTKHFIFCHIATVDLWRTIMRLSCWELQGWGSQVFHRTGDIEWVVTTHSISPVPFPPSIYTSSSLHNLIISNPSSMTSSMPSHSSSSAALHRLLLTSLAWAEDSRSEVHVASGDMTCSNNWVICWPVCTPLCFE